MFRFRNSKREIRILSARAFSSEVQGRKDKKEALEIGSGVEGVHEAIDDIVKAMHLMMGTYIKK